MKAKLRRIHSRSGAMLAACLCHFIFIELCAIYHPMCCPCPRASLLVGNKKTESLTGQAICIAASDHSEFKYFAYYPFAYYPFKVHKKQYKNTV